MGSLLRPMTWREKSAFAAIVGVSVAAHLLLAWFAASPGERAPSTRPQGASPLAERFAAAVNAVTDLDARERARIDEALARLIGRPWQREGLGASLEATAARLGVEVEGVEVVRAHDPERSREGRWDLRLSVAWPAGRGGADFLVLAYLAGEATLRSDFGSHRLWADLSAPEGRGRVAFETVDCRLFRTGKLGASDLMHRAVWDE